MIYCPYSDKDIPNEESSSEHILPLSLGGINTFEILVSKRENSAVGSTLDGLLAEDYLIKKCRNKYDIRGHSNKKPFVEFRRARCAITQKPLNVTFDAMKGVKVWSHQEKKELTGGNTLELQLKMDIDLDLMFVAKVALSAGYFAYGELFRNHVNHHEFRIIMNNRPNELDPIKTPLSACVDSRFSITDEEPLQLFRLLCEKTAQPCSIVGLVPSASRFTVFVGILGNYIGTINVPADGTLFPNSGSYEKGHVICIQNGKLNRVSFKRVLEKFFVQ
ncbi:hypothetical protein [Cellvibrio sp. NN19]|uniref:hypothetical protein n=1 Tax=Cellvibrio chitinivorans TaxID=3102792 RepID=UPI002B40B6EB|nr:hypothetical protein [Cellvibrio sp. NN19]